MARSRASSRFLIRLKTKMNDRRYAFMYQAPEEYETYEALHELAEKLLGTGNVNDGVNLGIKIIDFSEVPSDILPVVVGLVGRLIYQIQFWSSPGEDGDARHPIVIVCDEAHLYLPDSAASTAARARARKFRAHRQRRPQVRRWVDGGQPAPLGRQHDHSQPVQQHHQLAPCQQD